MSDNLPEWEGASDVYQSLSEALAVMAERGHALPAVKDWRGRVIRSGWVSQDMRNIIEDLGEGEEEQLRWWQRWCQDEGNLTYRHMD